jgi:hypothetical protein
MQVLLQVLLVGMLPEEREVEAQELAQLADQQQVA